MAEHRFKSGFGQCQCLWCGIGRNGQPCGVDIEVRQRLKRFAAEHGRRWKAALRHLWMVGGPDDQGAIRRARNVIGPSGLDRITPRMLDSVPQSVEGGAE